MRKIESHCVGCPPEIGCLQNACPYVNVVHYYCNQCGTEGKLYHYDDLELCEECLLKQFEVVKGSDW